MKYVYKNNENIYYLKLAPHGVFCKDCGLFIKRIHGYESIHIHHFIILKEKNTIIYKRRRYKCPVCHTTTFEPNPFQSNHVHISHATILKILELLKDYNHTFASVGRYTNISDTVIQTVFDEHVQLGRHKLSTAVCMDEIYFSKKETHEHGKYIFLMIDFRNGLILDVLPLRRKGYLRSYFRMIPLKERELVQYVSMDMNETYRDIAYQYFPNALICVDLFHIMENVNRSLNNVRLKVMRNYEDNKNSHEYYLLKHKNYLLFKDSLKIRENDYKKNNHFKQKLSSQQLLNMLLKIDEKLKKAYHLKELISIFFDQNISKNTTDEIEAFFDLMIVELTTCDIKDFEKLAETFENRKTEILNSFYRFDNRKISNGPIEG